MIKSINQSLAHGLELLLTFENKRPLLTVPEISELLGFSQGKTYRVIRTLIKYHLIQENPGTAKYSLGLNALRLGFVAQQCITLGAIARPFMSDLSFRTKESVLLTALNGTKGICIEAVESKEPVRSSTYQPGEVIPLHSGASGKILMAYLPEEEWNRIIETEGLGRYTPNTIIGVDRLKKHLREVRKKGYAFSDREVHQDVRAVGAPILSATGRLVAGLSVVGPVYRMNKKKCALVAQLVIQCAEKISNHLELSASTRLNRKKIDESRTIQKSRSLPGRRPGTVRAKVI